MRPLGEDVSEVLEWVPASFKVTAPCAPEAELHGLRAHRAGGRAEPSDRARPGGTGSAGARVGSEVCDHQPLYRQAEMYAREGVELERSTLADWVGGTSRLLEPLVEALRRHVLSVRQAARR